MNTLFITNPRSGRRRNIDALEAIIRRTSPPPYTIERCGPKETLDSLLDSAERSGVEVVCAVGGDGTVSEIGKRLIGRSMALGIIPSGSGNGFARHLGIPLDPVAALDVLRDPRIESIDTAAVNDIPFLAICGIGLDAVIAHRFAASTTRGLRTYLVAGLRTLITYAPDHYTLRIDDQTIDTDALLIAVASSSQYGSNATIAPLASLQDGRLDVTIVRRIPILSAPLVVARLFSGSIHRSGHVLTFSARNITVERRDAGPAHIDGEPLLLPASLRFTVAPGSLRVAVPRTTSAF